jgi:hypothetical protein
MTDSHHAGRLLPMALCASALVMAALAVVFWLGLIDVGESRLVVTAIMAAVAFAELFMGIFLWSLSRSGGAPRP